MKKANERISKVKWKGVAKRKLKKKKIKHTHT